MLGVSFRQHKPQEGEQKGVESSSHASLRNSELAGGTMKVEPIEAEGAPIEDQIVEEVVLPESVGVGRVLRIMVLPFD